LRCGAALAVINAQCRACDHIYKRQQREREALARGREIVAYRPQQVRELEAAWVKAEAEADRIRRRWAAAYLRPFRGLSHEECAALKRKHYERHRVEEVRRGLAYKAAHPEKNQAASSLRARREMVGADGSVTPHSVAKLKRHATHCAYCDTKLLHKQTDHMIPLALGGEHSLKNIVIVCPSCNQHKHALSYEEWIERVDPKHRDRVIALFECRYGARFKAA
jgi:5-methylcytosine-specific restriction endonuclease McrA